MEIQIRKGTVDDLEQFLELLRVVHGEMVHKEWFYLDEPGEVRQMLQEGILEFWVAMDGARMAGAFSIVIPGLRTFNYGYDLFFDEAKLLQVVNMDTIAVHREYRGRGLQKCLMQEAEREVAKRRPRILLCTVHPDNVFSLNNILDQGYTIAGRLPKYGSERCLLRKNLL